MIGSRTIESEHSVIVTFPQEKAKVTAAIQAVPYAARTLNVGNLEEPDVATRKLIVESREGGGRGHTSKDRIVLSIKDTTPGATSFEDVFHRETGVSFEKFATGIALVLDGRLPPSADEGDWKQAVNTVVEEINNLPDKLRLPVIKFMADPDNFSGDLVEALYTQSLSEGYVDYGNGDWSASFGNMSESEAAVLAAKIGFLYESPTRALEILKMSRGLSDIRLFPIEKFPVITDFLKGIMNQALMREEMPHNSIVAMALLADNEEVRSYTVDIIRKLVLSLKESTGMRPRPNAKRALAPVLNAKNILSSMEPALEAKNLSVVNALQQELDDIIVEAAMNL